MTRPPANAREQQVCVAPDPDKSPREDATSAETDMTLAPSPPKTDLTVTARTDGEVCRMIVRGDLERATIRTLVDRLLAAEQADVPAVTIDLAGCESIDRVGACVLLDASQRARRKGWHFSVTNPSAPITELFRRLALSRTIQVDPTPNRAGPGQGSDGPSFASAPYAARPLAGTTMS